MSRSAADATRFTATSPQAQSKSQTHRTGAQTSRPAPGGPGRGGNNNNKGGNSNVQRQVPLVETPQEKVARLRAAHAARRAAEISTWDRVIIRGRSVADTAHRVTVLGLVGLSVVAAAVTAYSIYDLSKHNRRKKREWLDRQFENLQKELVEAARAERTGVATPEQLLLLNRERAAEESKRQEAARPGMFKSIKGLFTPDGLRKEEGDIALLDGEQAKVDALANSVPIAPVPDLSVPNMGTEKEGPVMKALNEHRRQGERALEMKGQQGGLLDRVAADAVESAKKGAGGWSSWLGLGSSGK